MNTLKESTSLLETITRIASEQHLPCVTGVWADSPAPASYLVLTPITEVLEVYGDNTAGVEVEHVRASLYTNGNYLTLRDTLTGAFLNAGLTVEARTYVGFEADTGYHHYAFDLANAHPFPETENASSTGLRQGLPHGSERSYQ